jgi:hypothetical protein
MALMHASREPFGERCARAVVSGALVSLPDEVKAIGVYDATDGELHLRHGAASLLARWIGRPVSRGDIAAGDNRTDRRAHARRLFYEGRHAEAARIDPRMGL